VTTDESAAPARRSGLGRRVAELVRGTLAVLRHAGALLSRSLPLLRLWARQPSPAARRLAVGTNAEHAQGAAPVPHPLPRANVARDAGPMVRQAPAAALPPRRSEACAVVRVDRDFGPRSYARTFAALQDTPSSKLLDLTRALMLDADVFAQLDAHVACMRIDAVLGLRIDLEPGWQLLPKARARVPNPSPETP
jgi:hypothetical protein